MSQTMSSFPSANITFYLKHLNKRACGKILDKTNWDSFTEYELRCRETDVFQCRITNGLLDNSRPKDVDENRFLVQEISLHHLTSEFQDYLLDNYLLMSRLEYELRHSKHNNLYVVVPYYDEDFEYYTHYESEDDTVYTQQQYDAKEIQKTIHHYFDYESDTQKETKVYPVEKHSSQVIEKTEKEAPKKPLRKFKFTLNPKTKNSYILYRTRESTLSEDKKTVTYTDGKEYPSRWALLPNYRMIMYTSKPPQSIAGWIVGLSKRDELLTLGATEVTH